MTSAIDVTKPITGQPTTASVRANFTTAANEISALQTNTTGAPFLSLGGGTMHGPIYLAGDPTDPRMPATKAYVDAGGGSGGGGLPEAPADGTLYARQDAAWLHAVNTAELNAAITAATYPDAPSNGTTYGRLNKTWAPAVTTAQMTAAIAAAAYPDAPNDGLAYLRLSGAWRYGIPQLGPSNRLAVVESTTGSDKSPVLCGPVTPASPGSDALKLQARRLGTPGSGGENNDGACIVLAGPSFPAGMANTIAAYTGNNAAGYKSFVFNADGSFTLQGNIYIALPASQNNGLGITAPNGGYARTVYTVTGTHTWSSGMVPDGRFAISDENRGVSCLTIDGSGQVFTNGHIFSGGGIAFSGLTNNIWTLAWDGPNTAINMNLDGTYLGVMVRSPPIAQYTMLTQFAFHPGDNTCAIWAPGNQYQYWTTAYSDRSLKSDVRASSVDALAIINQLPIYEATYTPPGEGAVPQHWDCALIADEVEPLIPAAFIAAPEVEGADTYDGLRDLPLICMLLRGVQQLSERVVALETAAT
jgi:hypothetical protein